MRFSGFAGSDAPRAVFRQLPAEFAALVVDYGSGMYFRFCWFDAPRAMLPRLPVVCSMLQLLSSCTWKSVHYFYEPPVFSACSAFDFLRESIFRGPRALTVVSARGPVVPESPGVYS